MHIMAGKTDGKTFRSFFPPLLAVYLYWQSSVFTASRFRVVVGEPLTGLRASNVRS
jgi:hypothetical protein